MSRTNPESGSRAGEPHRLGVLISGRGSNLRALTEAIEQGRLDARIVIVLSNRPQAAGLDYARQAGLDTLSLDHRLFASRDGFDDRLAQELRSREVDLVCLAGFMRLVGAHLLEAFPDAVLNIHPSLLPAFPGVNAQRQALDHGVKISGATVHLVTGELDGGPIVAQACVPVLDDDTVETLSERILVEEHRIYPEAVGLILRGGWQVAGRRLTTRP